MKLEIVGRVRKEEDALTTSGPEIAYVTLRPNKSRARAVALGLSSTVLVPADEA